MNSINSAYPLSQAALPPQNMATDRAEETGSFKQMLLGALQDVSSMQKQADTAVEALMTGGDVDPATVLTAVQKADLSFRLMMQMRNKMMEVYQEVKDIRI